MLVKPRPSTSFSPKKEENKFKKKSNLKLIFQTILQGQTPWVSLVFSLKFQHTVRGTDPRISCDILPGIELRLQALENQSVALIPSKIHFFSRVSADVVELPLGPVVVFLQGFVPVQGLAQSCAL